MLVGFSSATNIARVGRSSDNPKGGGLRKRLSSFMLRPARREAREGGKEGARGRLNFFAQLEK